MSAIRASGGPAASRVRSLPQGRGEPPLELAWYKGFMSRGIPRETQAFLRTYIRSIGQLELLLALRGSGGRAVTPAGLAKEQRIDPDVAAAHMFEMKGAGFLEGPDGAGGFQYSPRTPELAAQVDTMADVYKTYRVAVINFVFSMPSESVQSFADAFRIRKDDDGG